MTDCRTLVGVRHFRRTRREPGKLPGMAKPQKEPRRPLAGDRREEHTKMTNTNVTQIERRRNTRRLDATNERMMREAERTLANVPDSDDRHGVVVDTDDGPTLIRGRRSAIAATLQAIAGGPEVTPKVTRALDDAEANGWIAVFAVQAAERPRVLCCFFERGAA